VFKIGSTLTVSNNAVATLAGGMTCDQVRWGVGSSATLGTNSTFVGDILAAASITLNTGAAALGRDSMARSHSTPTPFHPVPRQS
jgi:hypothetical protein